MFENISSQQLAKAAALKEQIENLQRELEVIMGGQDRGTSSSSAVAGRIGRPGGKGGMSAAGKARIAAAQKARWARFHKQKGTKSNGSPSGSKPKRTMSAAAKARIATAARARWKKAKAAGKTRL